MGLMDVFKANENQQLKDRIAQLEAMLTPEMQNAINISDEIRRLEGIKQQKIQEINAQQAAISNNNQALSNLQYLIAQKQQECASLDEELMFESFGIYTPRYSFTKSEQYKRRLDEIRQFQKTMIKNDGAVLGTKNWTVNGSVTQGKKMVADMQKLLLRAFNGECDELVEKVKYNNFEASLKRINASCDAISKLGSMMNISISPSYRAAKIDELTLAFEYAQLKQKEKEDEKEERARLREEAKLQKEIEEERRKIEKEQTHYLNALAKLNVQLAADPDSPDLLAKKQELEGKVADAEKALKDVDYREANKRAGYVYVISNIGAFGKNVYKIGMTRRLDPQERVDELGDASVPFGFDVHAMIFSDDAPKLEAALHRAFEDRKVNMVNPRREFFHVTLDEIKAVIRQNYDKTVEFNDFPDAEQWRISVKMRNGQFGEPEIPEAVPEKTPARTAPSPVQQPAAPKNLAEQAIELIRAAKPGAECTYTADNGVYSVTIKAGGALVGRLRISNRHCVKCDYFGADKSLCFFGDIDRIKDLI